MIVLFGANGRLGSSLKKYSDINVSRRRDKEYEYCDYTGRCLRKIMEGAEKIIIATGSTKTYNKDELYKSNVELTKRIVENAPKNALIVLASSISVYGKNIRGVADEKTKINIDSKYAKTKYLSEKIVEKRDGLILRLGTLYGSQFEDYYYVLNLIERGKMPIIGGGCNNIPFTYIEDVVPCFFKEKRGVYVVAGKGARQIDVLTRAAELLGVKKPDKKIPYWIAYSLAWVEEMKGSPKITREHIAILGKNREFNSTKAKNELGFKETEFFKGLEKMIERYKELRTEHRFL